MTETVSRYFVMLLKNSTSDCGIGTRHIIILLSLWSMWIIFTYFAVDPKKFVTMVSVSAHVNCTDSGGLHSTHAPSAPNFSILVINAVTFCGSSSLLTSTFTRILVACDWPTTVDKYTGTFVTHSESA